MTRVAANTDLGRREWEVDGPTEEHVARETARRLREIREAGAEVGRATTSRPTRLWFGAAVAGFATGCLVFVVDQLPGVSALSAILVVLAFFFVPYVILLVGAVGILAYSRDQAVRVRAIAAVVFAVAWAATQILLSQLHLAGVV